MLEKNESRIEGAGGGLKVGELRYRAMREGGPRTGNGIGNGQHLLDVAGWEWETLIAQEDSKGMEEKVKDDFQDLAWVAINGNVMF